MPKLLEPETARLKLRQWRDSDRQPFAEMNADPRVMEYFSGMLDRAQSDALADRIQSLIKERGWGFWALERKSDEMFLGFIGIHSPSSKLPCSPCIEIGWRLAYPYWGRGYATEAGRMALQTGFKQLGFDQIVSFTALRNHRSRALMQRLGMVDTGENFMHPDVPEDSGLKEHCLYRMSREDWRSIKHQDR